MKGCLESVNKNEAQANEFFEARAKTGPGTEGPTSGVGMDQGASMESVLKMIDMWAPIIIIGFLLISFLRGN